jgi:hypothetical protein
MFVAAEQTEYSSGCQYRQGKLQFFPTAEGYVDATGGRYNYVFQYKDHLGNIRLSYTQKGESLVILEENHYYPFGMKHNNYNSSIFDYWRYNEHKQCRVKQKPVQI